MLISYSLQDFTSQVKTESNFLMLNSVEGEKEKWQAYVIICFERY